MEKAFAWQQNWEKILYISREYFLSFFFSKIQDITISILIFSLWLGIWISIEQNIIVIISILFLLFVVLRYLIMYLKTKFYITSRRVVKLVRNGLITEHKKEKKLEDIKQLRADKKSLTQKLLNYWTLEIESTYEDKSNIYFKWVKLVWEVSDYIWVITSYIKENWKTDDLSSFKSRKDRKRKS